MDNTTTTNTEVLVVGGGIGGLAAALAMKRNGADVTLVERAPEFGEVGAGLQLAPNATRVLRDWGLLEKVLDVGVAPKHIVFRDAVTGAELLRQNVQGRFAERYGAPYVVVHRTDLHRIILDAAAEAGVTLLNDAEVTGTVTVGSRVCATIRDGRTFEADVALAADGLHSALRAQIADDKPIPSGYVAFRGALPVSEVKYQSDMEDVVIWLGPHCHLVQYPLRKGEMFNTVAVFRSPAFLRGEQMWGSEDELEEAYQDCVPEVRSALANLWRVRSWPMFDRVPIPDWIDGRTALLGDSAHPMLQYLAQGACQALEDARTLERITSDTVFAGGSVDNAQWDEALSRFNRVRAPRTARVQRTARVWGESWHVSEPVEKLLRDMLFASAVGDVYRFTDWAYAVEATDALEAAAGPSAAVEKIAARTDDNAPGGGAGIVGTAPTVQPREELTHKVAV
ncbi:3-hydroxybenzoate 6-hydroxylase [Tersicoccus phoenicis]|uniref:3-hydroxybenzoate 6-hydroxylase n=1 Tax=Tersicoccus phoenicis TaxID=554083 RepID=A0A1R1L7Y8_9MICC|nr:FAD-dependent monooxygenase [Tersicoccus phoenicis]OMH23646.1 3-hydroxybenzoate 6-hydroxylase [Tersicoccus phoenicis]